MMSSIWGQSSIEGNTEQPERGHCRCRRRAPRKFLLPLFPLPLGRGGRGRITELEELHQPVRLLERAASERRLRQQAKLLHRLLQKLLLLLLFLVPLLFLFLTLQKGLAQQELHESRVVHLATAEVRKRRQTCGARKCGTLHTQLRRPRILRDSWPPSTPRAVRLLCP